MYLAWVKRINNKQESYSYSLPVLSPQSFLWLEIEVISPCRLIKKVCFIIKWVTLLHKIGSMERCKYVCLAHGVLKSTRLENASQAVNLLNFQCLVKIVNVRIQSESTSTKMLKEDLFGYLSSSLRVMILQT